MKRILSYLLLAVLLVPMGCTEDPLEEPKDNQGIRYYGNLFAYNIMKTYYLWEAEVSEGFASWTYGEDPVEKVKSMRYKDSAGNPVDKWTTLYEDCSSFERAVTGNAKSFGFDFKLFYTNDSHKEICAVITFIYADSPASKAHLKRGDTIFTVDGRKMTPDNYADIVNEKFYAGDTARFGFSDGREITLTGVQMYENPVQTVLTLDVEGKKMGYLHFTSFTMDACRDLEKAFGKFKEDGVEEMIVDLRYNGGGYTLTSAVLGSMLAPVEEVKSGSVFNRDIYNKTLSESDAFKDDLELCFAEEFTINASSGSESYKVHPLQVNPEIRKVWIITTSSTASASEALVCGLKPYMDVALVGETTYGKFCGGYLIYADEFFKSLSKQEKLDFDVKEAREEMKGWGLYVIASRYSDKDGVTLSMPNGIPADFEAKDNPFDGYMLGDPSEAMLSRVLALATGKVTKAPLSAPTLDPAPPVRRPGFGVLLH